MAAVRRSVTFDADLWARLERLGLTAPGVLSTLVGEQMRAFVDAEEARRGAQRDEGLRGIREFEDEHGPLDPDLIDEAERRIAAAAAAMRGTGPQPLT